MRGLLIRSTSIQHTGFVIERLREVYPGIDVDILTHPHAIGALNNLNKGGRVFSYSYKGSFGVLPLYIGRLFPILKKSGYDIAIIPAQNMSGIGYENVMAMAAFISPRILLCNLGGEIKTVERTHIFCNFIKAFFFYPIAVMMTMYLLFKWFFALISLTILRKRIEKS